MLTSVGYSQDSTRFHQWKYASEEVGSIWPDLFVMYLFLTERLESLEYQYFYFFHLNLLVLNYSCNVLTDP